MINSGEFPTETQDEQYKELVGTLINLLQSKICYQERGQKFDEVYWTDLFMKLYRQLHELEKVKSAQPKYTAQCRELARLYFNKSQMSSRASSTGTMTPRSSRSLAASSRGFNSNREHPSKSSGPRSIDGRLSAPRSLDQRSTGNRSVDGRSEFQRVPRLPAVPNERHSLAPLSEIDEIGGIKRRRQTNQRLSSVNDISKLTASTTKRRRNPRRARQYRSPGPPSLNYHRITKHAYEKPYNTSMNSRRRAQYSDGNLAYLIH